MTTTARSDIHRPSAPEFDPQKYELVAVFDLKPFDGTDGEDPKYRLQIIAGLKARGYSFASHVGQTHQCGHCGAALRYAALMQRDDVHELIYIGETCLDGRFELSKPEFDRLRKQSQLDREKQRLLAGFNQLLEDHPELVPATYTYNLVFDVEAGEFGHEKYGTGWATSTIADILGKARQYGGSISDKQIAFVVRLYGEVEAKVSDFFTPKAPKPDAGPAPTGRVQVEGLVIKETWKEGYLYNSPDVLKITVKLDNGSIVWGTAPSSLLSAPRPSYLLEGYDPDETGCNPRDDGSSLRGKRVRFTATFEPKPDDESFAFFKRPTSAEVIASE